MADRIYPATNGLSALTIPVDVKSIQTHGFDAEGDGGGWFLVELDPFSGAAQPWHRDTNAGARRWELRTAWATPEQFGAASTDDGSDAGLAAAPDARAAILTALDYCGAFGAGLQLTRRYRSSDQIELAHSGVTIQGVSRDRSTLYVECDAQDETTGVLVSAPDCTIRDLEIRANSANRIRNGEGSFGCCVTIGKVYYGRETQDDPELISHTTLTNLSLTRAYAGGACHALACVGRVSGVYADNIHFIGPDRQDGLGNPAYHGDAVLCHWGAQADPFPVDSAGELIMPLVLQKDPEGRTYHPNNITFTNVRARNTGRLLAASSVYNVHFRGVDFDGGIDDEGANGCQILDLVVGDEADTYAHPDDKQKVYSNITIGDLIGWNVKKSGEQAETLIDISGTGTSKFVDDPAIPGVRLQSQPKWSGVEFYNWSIEGDRGTVDLVNVRNFNGQITFRNVHGVGRPGADAQPAVGALNIVQTLGQIVFDNCSFQGPSEVNACDGVTFRNCRISNDFDSELAADEEFAIRLTGETEEAVLNAAAAKGATVLDFAGNTFPNDLKVGDALVYSGGTVYVTIYAQTFAPKVNVTPLPTAAGASTVFALDRRARNITFEECDIRGGHRALDIASAFNVHILRSRVRDARRDGVLLREGAEASLDGVWFSNNGLRQVDEGPGTICYDVAQLPTSRLIARNLKFTESRFVTYNVRVNADAHGSAIRDSVFAGTPQSGYFSAPLQLSNGAPLAYDDNVDGDGGRVTLSADWTPVPMINNNPAGIVFTGESTFSTRGDQVFVNLDMQLSSKGSTGGTFTIGGLPFPAASAAGGEAFFVNGAALTSPFSRVSKTGQTLLFSQHDDVTIDSVSHLNLTDTTRIRARISYRI